MIILSILTVHNRSIILRYMKRFLSTLLVGISVVPVHGHAQNLWDVTRIIDGDTIEIETGDQVRLVGIDATETIDSGGPAECWSGQAHSYLQEILSGYQVYFEYSSQSRRDDYDRVLAYVYRSDGKEINKHLIETGFAKPYGEYIHDRILTYAAAGENAQLEKLGYWGEECKGNSVIYKSVSSQNPLIRTTPELTAPYLYRLPAINAITTYYTGV